MKLSLKNIHPLAAGFCLLAFCLALAFGLLLPTDSFAQLGNPGSYTASVNGAVTTNGVGTISLANHTKVAVQLTTTSDAANISNTVVSFDQRVGSGAWVSTGKTMTIANTGTTAANCVSNWVELSDAAWRVNIQNGAVAGVTNSVVIRYNLKP